MACSIRVKPGNLRSRPSPSVRGGPARRHGNLPRRRCTRRSGGANLLNCNVVCHIPIETNSAAAAQREATMWSKARDLSTSRRVIHSFCGQTTPRWAYSRDMEPSPLSIQSKAPGSGVGKNPSQPLCNLRPCASRFARCSWVYLYEVRGRWAWDCRLCRPQRTLRQSPLCPFAFFAPEAYSGGSQGDFS